MSSFMKISGTLRNLFFLAILAAGVSWLWQAGKLAPIETIKAMIFGKAPEKHKAEDFQFKPVTRQNVNQKVLATGTVTLKTVLILFLVPLISTISSATPRNRIACESCVVRCFQLELFLQIPKPHLFRWNHRMILLSTPFYLLA